MSKTQTEIQAKPKRGILLKCPKFKCGGRIWRYKGSMKIYAVCPDCRGNVNIATNKIEESENESS